MYLSYNKNEAWSFGKASRSKSKENRNPGPGEYSNSFYNKSSPKWIIGAKIPTRDKNINPGVGKYEIHPKIFDGPKYSINQAIQRSKTIQSPGPDSYSPNKSNFAYKDNPKYSFGTKSDIKNKNTSPGPMYYPNKPYHIHSNIFGKQSRDQKIKSESPAPNMYLPNKVSLKKYPAYHIGMKLNNKDHTLNPDIGPGRYNPDKNDFSPNYLFPQEKRLKEKKNMNPGVGSYDLNINNLKTSPGYKLGKSQREFFLPKQTPGPIYSPKYHFKKSPEYSMPARHNNSKPNLNPGPGQYNLGSKFNPKITIKQKLKDRDLDPTPGPNHYDYDYNKIKRSNPKYSLGNSQRTYNKKDNNPGPNMYQLPVLNKGPVMSFGRDNRNKQKVDGNPGPADYHIPCSIRDVPTFVRKTGAFLPEWTFI